MEKYREVVGHVIKEEQISLVKHHILPGSVVVNIDHPFPGFHGWDFDFNAKPRSIIILTAKLYSWAKILRAQASYNNETGLNINASFAKILIGKTVYYGIRVKGLESYEQIPDLQTKLQNYGFELLKNKKLKTDKPVSIKISKFFHIKTLDDSIYADKCIDNMYYIEIPKYLPWETFRSITMHVKHNVSNNNFDVAKGLFYKDNTVKDIIRLFKPKMSLELLQEIKTRYEKEIAKL
jgi:hypothetical protein